MFYDRRRRKKGILKGKGFPRYMVARQNTRHKSSFEESVACSLFAFYCHYDVGRGFKYKFPSYRYLIPAANGSKNGNKNCKVERKSGKIWYVILSFL